MALQIKPACKFKQFARVCLWGTQKQGKTHGALALATAFAGDNGKVGVISSEYASSQLLQHRFPHDIVNLAEVDENSNLVKGAFSPQRYEEAIKLFTNARYDVIVIDSLSHVWEGEGGLLESVSSTPQGKSNFDDGWGKATPLYKHLINTILAARCHLIITLRGKDAYIHEDYTKRNGERGTRPKNVGQAPIMRKGFGYEMHLTLHMDDMVAHVEATAMQDYIPKGEQIDDLGGNIVQRILDALDGVPLPEPTEQQKEMRSLLDEFYNLSPTTYARINNWEQLALRKALSIPVGAPVPTDYTDEHVALMQAYVASKRKPDASPPQTEEKPQPVVVTNAPTPVANDKQADEQKPTTQAEKPKLTVVGCLPTKEPTPATQEPSITAKQIDHIRKLSKYLNKPEPDQITALTDGEARQIIQQLTGEYKATRLGKYSAL
jgi:hypothetical protein